VRYSQNFDSFIESIVVKDWMEDSTNVQIALVNINNGLLKLQIDIDNIFVEELFKFKLAKKRKIFVVILF
jgi:hypothetical protein